MSTIYEQLDQLTEAHNSIITSLESKGVDAHEHGFTQFASDINQIGGGEQNYCKITFDTNGGTYINYCIVESGSLHTITDEIPKKEMYIFNSWNTSPDGTGTTYNPEDSISITEDITLYSIYDELTDFYTLYTNLSNGEGGAAILLPLDDNTENTAIEITFMRNNSLEGCLIGRGYKTSSGIWYQAFRSDTSIRGYIYNSKLEYNPAYAYSTVWSRTNTLSVGVMYTITLGWTYYKLNGVMYTQTPDIVEFGKRSDTGLYSLYDWYTNTHTYIGALTVQSVDIFDDDLQGNVVYKHKYRPAVRISDSEPGLLDIINGSFLTNENPGFSFSVS